MKTTKLSDTLRLALAQELASLIEKALCVSTAHWIDRETGAVLAQCSVYLRPTLEGSTVKLGIATSERPRFTLDGTPGHIAFTVQAVSVLTHEIEPAMVETGDVVCVPSSLTIVDVL